MGERTARVFAWVAAAAADGEGDGRISPAALCRAARTRLQVDGVSMTAMTGHGMHTPVAASGELAAELEELQVTLGEGPGLAAFTFGSPMLVPDLATSTARWPGFATAARERGVAAVFAFPLHTGTIQLGVLELHRAETGPLTTEDLANVLVFADLGLQLLLDSSSGVDRRLGYRPADEPARGRDAVHQATGMIAVQLGVGVAEALARLRAHAFTSETPLNEVAADVVARRLRFRPETEPDEAPG
ncbi:GAF domain-containing protein [Prauserella aidingensis]|uniref:GAF and ANTAR domain-containing protein n=1 Tax=Prauserella aidingensis TaxID=387890 RepID=UPI0020A4F64B|nr:GAF and ANTAR domain-containing protein [Prauserella aidingensis]MCP2254791.1 GAF domain-containing protein [Prauserella aidingensis]